MKRRAFIKELEAAGCELQRHGAKHDLYRNPVNGNQCRDIGKSKRVFASSFENSWGWSEVPDRRSA